MMSATKNSFWYLGFNLSRLLVLFFGNMWISRVLGPLEFGQFSYFLSAIIYISSLDSLCHESVIKQHLVKDQETGLVLGTASFLGLMLALVATCLILGFGLIAVKESFYWVVLLLFIPGQFSKPFNPIANSFDIKLLSKYSSMALLIGAFCSMVFRTLGLSFSHELYLQSFGYSLQTLIYGFVLFWLYQNQLKMTQWRVSTNLLFDIIKKSFPIFLSSVIFLSFSLSDIFMIRHMLGLREVGIYSIAVKLCEPWVIVSSAMCTSFFPLIFRYGAALQKQAKYFITANQLSIYFVGVLGIFLCLAIDLIVKVMLGPSYSEVGGIFRIYYWSILFLFFANVQHMWEVFNGKYSLAVYKTGLGCLLKIVLNVIFGNRYGLHGFALATLVSFFFYGMGFNIFMPATRPYLRLQLRAFSLIEFKKNYRLIRLKGKKWLR
jgi:O-antigen/teichoic acid export membrane protein